jgi:hypothetical protein
MPLLPYPGPGEFRHLLPARPQIRDTTMLIHPKAVEITLLVREIVEIRKVEDSELLIMGHLRKPLGVFRIPGLVMLIVVLLSQML